MIWTILWSKLYDIHRYVQRATYKGNRRTWSQEDKVLVNHC